MLLLLPLPPSIGVEVVSGCDEAPADDCRDSEGTASLVCEPTKHQGLKN